MTKMNENKNIEEFHKISERDDYASLKRLLKDKFSKKIICIALSSYEGCTIAEISKRLNLHRTEVEREIKPVVKEGDIFFERKKGMGNKKFLRINQEKIKQYLEDIFRYNLITFCDALNYFFKDRLDEPTTINKIIKEITESKVINKK